MSLGSGGSGGTGHTLGNYPKAYEFPGISLVLRSCSACGVGFYQPTPESMRLARRFCDAHQPLVQIVSWPAPPKRDDDAVADHLRETWQAEATQ